MIDTDRTIEILPPSHEGGDSPAAVARRAVASAAEALAAAHRQVVASPDLLARDFPKALAVADHAHALLPNNLSIETNRAHALLFLNRRKDAADLLSLS